ncbi:MAG: hypothetical protein JWN76_2603 [Chitinophagaceae bacterium]|nr:hypothetical protein [Chitinophagaceae bacterium]
MHSSRRDFLKAGALTSTGLLLSRNSFAKASIFKDGGGLHDAAWSLLQQWGHALLSLQVHEPSHPGLQGGLLCPACATVHGRCGDAIYPFLYLADRIKDAVYTKAAVSLYDWMENTVSLPDGSWINEIAGTNWKGTTVFGMASLAESLIHFSHLLSPSTVQRWKERLGRAADYVYQEFTIETGNINYPVSASYALELIGQYLGRPHYQVKAKELAHAALNSITPNDHLLFGEGHPAHVPSSKGCYAVDLGYNVEESLPSLVLYAQLTKDDEVMNAAVISLNAHLEFMLPDGAWDNSWGTRNFKWTYWGSRTSDGCQHGYGLLASTHPVFYTAALKNTQLMQACTHKGLLYSGPHNYNANIPACVHHTFSHAKALTSLLLRGKESITKTALLPRENKYGVKQFKDIATWLVSSGQWKGTVTGYDVEYTMKSGHASGGALTMLWHEKAGPVIVASMNQYQLVEAYNMQRDKDPFSICLTPRFEITKQKIVYTNINDLDAAVTATALVLQSKSRLVDENQSPLQGSCSMEYNFTGNEFNLRGHTTEKEVRFILPVIAASNEKASYAAPGHLQIEKPNGILHIRSAFPFKTLQPLEKRHFNYVPGLQAIAIVSESPDVSFEFSFTAT